MFSDVYCNMNEYPSIDYIGNHKWGLFLNMKLVFAGDSVQEVYERASGPGFTRQTLISDCGFIVLCLEDDPRPSQTHRFDC